MLPGTCFACAMMLAGALVRVLGLLPRGISLPTARAVGGAIIGLVAYPVGYLAVVVQVIALYRFSPEDPPGHVRGASDLAIGYLTTGGIFFAGAAATLLMMTVAFAIIARYWPRRVLRTFALLVSVTIVGTMLVSLAQFLATLQRTPDSSAFRNFFGEPLLVFFGFGWGIPLAVFVGEPLFAAVVGHWLYRAAEEWSAERA